MATTKNKVLSPFPYYGGKAKMAPLICSLLDYDNTNLYIEPFGGGCRTLLNKKKHEQEIYNDFGYGLTTFFNVMANEYATEELISLLLENPPTKDSFNDLVIKRMETEDRLTTSSNAVLSSMALDSYRNHNISTFKDLRKKIRDEDYRGIVQHLYMIMNADYISKRLNSMEFVQYQHYYELYKDFWDMVEKERNETFEDAKIDFEEAWLQRANMELPEPNTPLAKLYDKHLQLYAEQCATAAVYSYTNDIINNNPLGTSLSDVDIAFMIFQLYYCSRDGMGTTWSDFKNRNINKYYKTVDNLRNVSKRMRDVNITQCDALDLVRLYRTYDNVMIYLDPSYLKPEDEMVDLGRVYKMSYSYMDHEKLLREIIKPDTHAKILISNYDVDLYNTYLCDWKKTYYKTFTSVGGKKNNRRIEVLWQNY